MTKMIKKAVIPCAGRGSRLLPATRALPKELFTIVDKPCLDYLVDELAKSGIEEVLIIISPEKTIIKKYFDGDAELFAALERGGNKKQALLALPRDDIKITYAVQERPTGTADAVAIAEDFCENQPFVLMWGDDIIKADVPVAAQLVKEYSSVQKTIIGCQEIELCDISKYGVLKLKDGEKNKKLQKIEGIIEKPSLADAPSRLASLGRYVITPDIFDVIKKTPMHKQERQFCDTLNIMSKSNDVYAYTFDGVRYDMGDRLGTAKAYLDFALENEEIGKSLKDYLERKFK